MLLRWHALWHRREGGGSRQSAQRSVVRWAQQQLGQPVPVLGLQPVGALSDPPHLASVRDALKDVRAVHV